MSNVVRLFDDGPSSYDHRRITRRLSEVRRILEAAGVPVPVSADAVRADLRRGCCIPAKLTARLIEDGRHRYRTRKGG